MDKSLSNIDIANLIAPKKMTLIPNSEVKLYNNIKELFATPYVVLCYLTRKNYGHWVGLYYNKKHNRISFFDSYGQVPDDQIDSIPVKFRAESNQEFPYLLNLLSKYDGEVHYNNKKLQKYGPDINTCGRWVAIFFQYCDKIPIEEFTDIFDSIKKLGIDLDQLVTWMT